MNRWSPGCCCGCCAEVVPAVWEFVAGFDFRPGPGFCGACAGLNGRFRVYHNPGFSSPLFSVPFAYPPDGGCIWTSRELMESCSGVPCAGAAHPRFVLWRTARGFIGGNACQTLLYGVVGELDWATGDCAPRPGAVWRQPDATWSWTAPNLLRGGPDGRLCLGGNANLILEPV